MKNVAPPNPIDAWLFSLKIIEKTSTDFEEPKKIEAFYRLINELETFWVNVPFRIVC